MENLVEIGLRFAAQRPFEVKAYSDGFELQDVGVGGRGWFRQLPLAPVGWLGFTEENRVWGLRVWGCSSGSVEPPSAAASEPPGREAAFRMSWPAVCTSTMEEVGAVVRYALRWSEATPARWLALDVGRVWIGLSADGAIGGLIVETPRLEPARWLHRPRACTPSAQAATAMRTGGAIDSWGFLSQIPGDEK